MRNASLEQRVSRLEKQNRRLRAALVAVAALLAVPVLLAAGAPRKPHPQYPEKAVERFGIVYAHKFVLNNPYTGKVKAELAYQEKAGGWIGLQIYDDEGAPRSWLRFWGDGSASIALVDEERRPRAEMKMQEDGSSSFVISGEEAVAFKAP